MKLTTNFKPFLLALCFLLCSGLSFAQGTPGGPGNPGMDPDPDPPPSGTEIPVDLGLSLFVAAGVGYAVKKRAENKKRSAIK